MTDIPFTEEEGELVDMIIGWLLDQDHDSIEGDYLWFLTENQEEGNMEEIEKVRGLLNGMYGKASRGVTKEDMMEVAEDDGELVYVVITPDLSGEPSRWDIELLSSQPQWNWYASGQIVRAGCIDGGDTIIVNQPPGTAYRADVTRRLANAFNITIDNARIGSEEAMLYAYGVVTGIVNEYRDGGDQMVEATCICQVGPGGHRVLNPVCPDHGVSS